MAPRKKGLPEITEEEMPEMPEVVQEEALETTTVADPQEEATAAVETVKVRTKIRYNDLLQGRIMEPGKDEFDVTIGRALVLLNKGFVELVE